MLSFEKINAPINGNFLGEDDDDTKVIPQIKAKNGKTAIDQAITSGKFQLGGSQLLSNNFAKEAADQNLEVFVTVQLTGRTRENKQPGQDKPRLQMQFTLPTTAKSYKNDKAAENIAKMLFEKKGKTGFVSANEICADAISEGISFDAGTQIVVRATAAYIGESTRPTPFFTVESVG